MRTMVTGGAGFIGSTLVDRLLAEGHEVDVVDDLSTGRLGNLAQARLAPERKFRFHQLDVRDEALVALVAQRRPEVVFHLAAQADVRVSVARPVFDAEVNILGTVRVAEGIREVGSGTVVLAASGGTLYGEPDSIPTDESAPQRPLSPYGVSKKAACDYLAAYRALHGLDFVALALANVYGPRQDPHGEAGVVAIFTGRLLDGEDCVIFGDGGQTRDFVFVDDVVDAFVRAGERGGGMLLNVGTGIETSVNELFDAIAAAVAASTPGRDRAAAPVRARHAPPRPGELARSALSPARAAAELDWKPWTSLADGIAAVVEFERGRRREAGAS